MGCHCHRVVCVVCVVGAFAAQACRGLPDEPAGPADEELSGDPPRPAPVAGPPAPPPPATPDSRARAERANPTALPFVNTCRSARPGPAPLRRLTHGEYDNTVRDLLGDDTQPSAAFPAEELGNGFGNDARAQAVPRLLVERYHEAAETIAARATEGPKLAALLPCDPARDGEESCGRAFIAAFGRRAYRRPLSTEEAARLEAIFASVRNTDGFAAGVRAVIAAALQAPQFLYRLEGAGAGAGAGDDSPGTRALDGYERASRLSYLLWGSMPDEALFRAAREGRLDTAAGVRSEAERLLASARARAVVRAFHSQLWGFSLTLQEKDPEVFPRIRPDTASLLREESERFVDHVVFEGAGDLATLIAAPYTFRNKALAEFYGEGALPGSGSDWQRVTLAAGRRAGVLTHGSVLGARTPGTLTNPTRRGVFVRRLLCASIPEPPAGFDLIPPGPDGAATTRELFAAHAQDPTCAPCHKLLDPIGFGFENFDAIGLWRDTESGRRIDARGQIADTDVAGAFNGPVALVRKLAASRDLHRCYVGSWFTFAHGRAETADDRGSRAAIEASFLGSDTDSGTGVGNVRALLLALTQTEAFLCRGGTP